jgi:hypothetical protein
MLLLEDKSVISEMNKLSEEQQKALVISYAKQEDLEIYFGTIKKKQKDSKNFHILLDNGVVLQREEFVSYWEPKRWVLWSIMGKDFQKRIHGDFGSVIYAFNKTM